MSTGAGTSTVKLGDGARVLVRPIEPDDKELLLRGFERLSEESRYRRFASPMPELSPAQVAYLTEVDHHDHEALIAIDSETGEGIGTARYVRSLDEPTVAEAAVTVVDDWQGRGLGGVLMERLADRAREEGVEAFTAIVQRDNVGALRMLDRLGDAVSSAAGPQAELRIELPEAGTGPELRDVLRTAAAGSLAVVGALAHRAAASRRPMRARAEKPRDPERIATVIAGTDGSESARRSVRAAIDLARSPGATLHLVSAYNPRAPRAVRRIRDWVPDGLSDLSWVVTGREQAEAALADAADSAEGSGLTFSKHAREGDPAGALLAVATEQEADLIVVGSKGIGGTGRGLLGTVAAKVSQHAPCSVLIVRTGEDPRVSP